MSVRAGQRRELRAGGTILKWTRLGSGFEAFEAEDFGQDLILGRKGG